jgi:hypothetical protein
MSMWCTCIIVTLPSLYPFTLPLPLVLPPKQSIFYICVIIFLKKKRKNLDCTHERKHIVFVFLSLAHLLNMTISRCKLHTFILYGWIIFHCVFIPHFLYLFICWGQLHWLYSLTVVNSDAINLGGHTFLLYADTFFQIYAQGWYSRIIW